MTTVDPASVAAFAAGLGDPTRMAMCLALVDGRAWTAGELAREAGVAASTASEHLSHLVDLGVLVEERQGRHRYLRLADDEVARIIEDLTVRAGRPGAAPRSLRGARVAADLAFARTCYDHVAGRLGVAVLDAMVAGGLVRTSDEVAITRRGRSWLTGLGGELVTPPSSRRPLARTCIDWTERRPHLAGTAGAALLTLMIEQDWVRRRPGARALTVTDVGRDRLRGELALDVAALSG
jgi:DNA-binding transcriptional ArsR family regulator